jgi:Cft2 family RNA processing exonuclease
MTLQERLQELSNIVYQHGQATRTPIPFHYGEPMKDATKAIEQDLMELLPEYQKASDLWHRNEKSGMKATEAMALTDAYNQALKDVRQKLQDYLGKV